jgi:hypothetical protein
MAHILRVTFEGDDLAPADQQHLLLLLERRAREASGRDVRVLAGRMGDDSRLRTQMTATERAKL